jgi:hypothetical protein
MKKKVTTATAFKDALSARMEAWKNRVTDITMLDLVEDMDNDLWNIDSDIVRFPASYRSCSSTL